MRRGRRYTIDYILRQCVQGHIHKNNESETGEQIQGNINVAYRTAWALQLHPRSSCRLSASAREKTRLHVVQRGAVMSSRRCTELKWRFRSCARAKLALQSASGQENGRSCEGDDWDETGAAGNDNALRAGDGP